MNSDFLRESFSDTEISHLKTDSAGHKVFFLSKGDLLNVEKRERIKHDYKDYYAVRWWLSDGYIVNTDGSFAYNRKKGWDDVCVVPAILVSSSFNETHFICNNCGHDFTGSDTEKVFLSYLQNIHPKCPKCGSKETQENMAFMY
ncbi:hypothetical protein [Treponema saccharophilum]|uniref:hypothetical protein n=1 Tax=Treponema saccharophilum TaxID=165 RepID=UPI00386590D6